MTGAGRVHFIGIGGVGMAGLAVLLKARGWEVSGCDLQATARTEWLQRQGIAFCVGHDAAHVVGADLVIATPAVHPDAPERQAAARLLMRGEVLSELVSAHGDSIAVCGSHGKTTTATFIAKLLRALGEDVSWCIGGETGDFPVAHAGKGPLVVEADESDGTLAAYRAKMLVVNRCDYDHPDYFKTEEAYFACYRAAEAQAGTVIQSEALAGTDWELPCLTRLAAHNRRNARAAIEVALRRGHGRAAIEAALPAVVAQLPDRRFERLAEGVYTDYAHHPTEMACAIAMAREVCGGRLRVLFQPHRYSRTKALLNDFPKALAGADEIWLCPTYAAFEAPLAGGTIADLAGACRAQGVAVRVADDCLSAWREADQVRQAGDVVLLLGAGDIINLKTLITQTKTGEEHHD